MTKSYSRSSDTTATAAGCSGCGCWVLILVCNLALGAISLNYCLESFLGRHIDTLPAVLGGLVLGQFTIPLAVLCWILRLAGIDAPFIH